MASPLTSEPVPRPEARRLDRSGIPGAPGPARTRRDQLTASGSLPYGSGTRSGHRAGTKVWDAPGSGASPATAPFAASIGVPSGDLATLCAVVDDCPVGVLVLDGAGRLVRANQAACTLLGLDARRLLAAHRGDYLDLGRQLQRLQSGGDPGPLRRLVVRPDGSARFIEFHLRSLRSTEHAGRATVYLLDEGPGDPQPPLPATFDNRRQPQDLDASADGPVIEAGSGSTSEPDTAGQYGGDHLRGQAEILRLIATGGPLEVTLGRLSELLTNQLNAGRASAGRLNPTLRARRDDTVNQVGPVACAVIAERAGGATAMFPGPGFPPLDHTGLLDALDASATPDAGLVRRLDALAGQGRSFPALVLQLASAGHQALVAVPINALPSAATPVGPRGASRLASERRAGPPDLNLALDDLAGLASPDLRPLGAMVCLLPAAAQLPLDELELLRSSADLAAIALERDRSERDLATYALQDPLTGLANRNLLVDRLSQALNRAKRRHRNLALMFLDLDRFKPINDSLGHHAGDLVLRQFAERLRVLVRPEDTVARFGGDEFVVLVEHVVDEQDAAQIAERVERAMADPFALEGRSVAVTVSVGIVIGSGEDDANTLLRKADAAMYRAKELGRNRTEVYDLALEAHLANRSQLALDLRHAIAEGLLQLRFRPLLAPDPTAADATTPALWLALRWADQNHAQLHTRDILALAEDSGQGLELAAWMMERALEGLARLTRSHGWESGRGVPRLAVPMTGRQLGHPELSERVLRALRGSSVLRTGTDGSVAAQPPAGTTQETVSLWVAVPEAGLSSGGEVAIRTLAELRRAGIGLALEEIGATPDSSLLSLLGRVTVDLLVVDASVVASLGQDESPGREPEADPATGMAPAALAAWSMAAGVAGLGRGVGLAVAAGGVDTTAQRERLGRLGYDLAWGEAMGPAVDIETLISLLASGGWDVAANG